MTASDSLEHTWLKRRGRGTAGASWAYVVPTAVAAPPVAATVTQNKPPPLIAHVSITVAAAAHHFRNEFGLGIHPHPPS